MIAARTLQHFLNIAGGYRLVEDNDFGPKSLTASRDYLADRRYPSTWPDSRTYIAIEQLFLNATIGSGLLVDGIAGRKTAAARAEYEGLRIKPEPSSIGPAAPPSPITRWPRQRDVPNFFGKDPRTAPMAYVTPPFTMYANYSRRSSDRVSRFMCHKLVKDPITRILNAAVEHYGEAGLRRLNIDIFSGCRVIRRVTGGTGYSMHSWGIAYDSDAAHNEFRDTWRESAFFRAEYKPWIDFWYAEGAINLGRERNYDPMHFQFPQL